MNLGSTGPEPSGNKKSKFKGGNLGNENFRESKFKYVSVGPHELGCPSLTVALLGPEEEWEK